MAKYPLFAVGQRETADLLTLGQRDTVIKLATTARPSTVVLASDPELTISGVAGTFRIEMDIIASGLAFATAAGDINVSWLVTGTVTDGYRCSGGPATVTDSPSAATTTRWRSTPTGTALTLGYPTDSVAQNFTRISEFSPATTFSTAWTIAIQWCQNITSVTATNVHSGSTLASIRLA
jgi:hypothetical protein